MFHKRILEHFSCNEQRVVTRENLVVKIRYRKVKYSKHGIFYLGILSANWTHTHPCIQTYGLQLCQVAL